MNILLPIETINRELDYKLILGVKLVEKDRVIYIGQHDYLFGLSRFLRSGLYLGKTMFKDLFPTNLKYYNELKARDIDMIHLDEEGAFYLGDEKNWDSVLAKRLDPNVLNHEDIICTWGDYQRNFYKNQMTKDENRPHIFTTGQPRFEINNSYWWDLYSDKVKAIKERYGDYILVNTNLAFVNPKFGLENIFTERHGYMGDHTDKTLNFVDTWSHMHKILGNVVLMVHKIAARFQDVNFIIRSHPAENDDFYNTVFKNVKNVHIVHDGPVAPWIIGSDAVIHDGCTTAVEAYFAEKKVVLFKSVEKEENDQFVPNLIGEKCVNAEEVIKVLENNKFKTMKVENSKAVSLLANFTSPDSLDQIVTLINNKIATKEKSDAVHIKFSNIIIMKYKLQFIFFLKALARIFFPARVKRYKAHQKKFYGFQKHEIVDKLDKIQKITGKKVKMDYFDSNLIVLSHDE